MRGDDVADKQKMGMGRGMGRDMRETDGEVDGKIEGRVGKKRIEVR